MNKKNVLGLGFSLMLGCIFFVGSVFSKDWDLPGIDLITRSEWGADESLRYAVRPEYQAMLKAREEEKLRIKKLKEEDFEEYLKIQQKSYERKMANQYLIDNFADEYSFDEIREYYNGNELRTPEYINNNKTKIIIHHSAADNSKIKTKADAIAYLKKTYKFHALTRWRGDIWYNFIIDPFGNIYEGRAGGEWTVGMHVKWNNTPSLGIMLMGNFEIQKPTDKQIESLIELSTILSAKYGINPNEKTYYSRDIKSAPYLESNSDYKIAGHTDAGYTACPGDYLYEKFPYIRQEISKKLLNVNLISDTRKLIKLPGIFYSHNNYIKLNQKLNFDNLQDCETDDDGISISNCKIENWILKLLLKKTSWKWSGVKTITLKNNLWETKSIVAIILWQKDLDIFVNKIKNNYLKKHTLFASFLEQNKEKDIKKISYKISIAETRKLLEQKIQVLLYELSTNFQKRNISCDWECTFIADAKIYTSLSGLVILDNKQLKLNINNLEINPQNIDIYSANNGRVRVENYGRKSYSGIPRNSFDGMISFQQDKILIDKKYQKQYVVINTVDFDDYLKWIVESNDTETDAKNEALALITKTYALFYIAEENQHPNIPDGAKYNAIDDPELFQKYVGAWLQDTLHKRFKALDKTKNQIIIYDGYVPILPYFHCSPGFTLNAQEKRWRNDTPYLQSRLDVESCNKFEWHWVGMSGKWAEWRAKHWFDYKKLIEYYYEGVEIVEI